MKQSRILTAFVAAAMGVVLFFRYGSLRGAEAASPQPVQLICRVTGYNLKYFKQQGPTLIDLDEATHTITVHFATLILPLNYGARLPAHTVGPVSANVTPDTITFENPDPNSAPNGGHDEYVLNRLTGALRGKWAEDKKQCHIATKQF